MTRKCYCDVCECGCARLYHMVGHVLGCNKEDDSCHCLTCVCTDCIKECTGFRLKRRCYEEDVEVSE